MNIKILNCLIAVGRSTHTGHHTENVVVDTINADLVTVIAGDQIKVQGSVVNTGEVSASRGLVVFGLQGEGVNIDTRIQGCWYDVGRVGPS